MLTVKKCRPTLENMGIAFRILSMGGTETEIHLGDNLTCRNVCFKHTVATLGLSIHCAQSIHLQQFSVTLHTQEEEAYDWLLTLVPHCIAARWPFMVSSVEHFSLDICPLPPPARQFSRM